MNKKLGKYSTLINAVAVAAVAVSGIIGSRMTGIIACVVIALSFVPMACTYAMYGRPGARIASSSATIFGGMYAAIGLMVYVTYLSGNDELAKLFVGFDLLSNVLMGVSTFFVSLALKVRSAGDMALRWLLRLNVLVAVACYVLPQYIGSLWSVPLIELWCVYFIAADILAYIHFSRRKGW